MTSARGNVRPAEALSPVIGNSDRARVFELAPGTGSIHLVSGCHSVVTRDGFYALEEIWRELSASSRRPTAFQSWDFAVEWLNKFVIARAGGATGRFAVVVAFAGKAGVVGLTPLFEEYTLGQ